MDAQTERLKRIDADRRWARAMELGSIAYHDLKYAVLVGMIRSDVVAQRIRVPGVVLAGPWQIN